MAVSVVKDEIMGSFYYHETTRRHKQELESLSKSFKLGRRLEERLTTYFI
jgi:hypothetical protein